MGENKYSRREGTSKNKRSKVWMVWHSVAVMIFGDFGLLRDLLMLVCLGVEPVDRTADALQRVDHLGLFPLNKSVSDVNLM